MLRGQNEKGSQHSPLVSKIIYAYRTAAVQTEHNQNIIAAIKSTPHTIKFHDNSSLFHQSLKRLAVVERLFWLLGMRFSGRRRCREAR